MSKDRSGSSGQERRLTTSIFTQVELFTDERKSIEDIKILGLIDNVRMHKYIPIRYLENDEQIAKFKVVVPKSNGSGELGETLSSPLVIGPKNGFTQSFIGIGLFEKEEEAESLLKYIKTKFARTLLGTLKVTQHNPPGTWKNIPLQDFTQNSDIDWSKSVPEIDKQLYKKYDLCDAEICFIEEKVEPMD